ncbi:hypothetical protein [uncultured Gammaproteobacteria bacterium]|nr:hypothetical protein BROOK1789B_1132 [Bathymodiolus brooksi thiotrophic gill symbiont]CAC9590983.1 hypothetical protein [uncultured Gammaproteobacteria bacterium]CAC9969807.1 hypothetical protein [uncultured Gammaproteobacteria bacterium]
MENTIKLLLTFMLIFPAYATTNHTVHEIIVKIERMVV